MAYLNEKIHHYPTLALYCNPNAIALGIAIASRLSMIMFVMSTSSMTSNLRLAELMAALSIATDFGMGQPLEFALQACVVAMRLGVQLRLSDANLRATYY